MKANILQQDIMMSTALDLRHADLLVKQKKYQEALLILEKVRGQLGSQDKNEQLTYLKLNAITTEHSIYIANNDFTKASSFLANEVKTLLDTYQEHETIPLLIFSQGMGQIAPYEASGKYDEALLVLRAFENIPNIPDYYHVMHSNKVSALQKAQKENPRHIDASKNDGSRNKATENDEQTNAEIEKEISQLKAQSEQLERLASIQKAMDSRSMSPNDIDALMALQEENGDLDAESKSEMEQAKKLMALMQNVEDNGITGADLSGNTEIGQQLNDISNGEAKDQLSEVTDQITALLGLEDISQIDNLSVTDMNLDLDAIYKMAEEEGIEFSKDSIAYAWNNLKTNDSLLYAKQRRTAEGNLSQLKTGNLRGTSELIELMNLANANIRLQDYDAAKGNLKSLETLYSSANEAEKEGFPNGFIGISYWGLYAAQGKFGEALKYIQKAVEETVEPDVNLLELMAMTYFQLKDFQNAKYWSGKGIDILNEQNTNPDNTAFLRIQHLFYYSGIAQGDYDEALKGLMKMQGFEDDDKKIAIYDLQITPQLAMAIASERTAKFDEGASYMSNYIGTVNDRLFEANLTTEVRMRENEEKFISDNIFYFLHEQKSKSNKVTGLAFDAALLFKEFQLNSDLVMMENYLSTQDSELKSLYTDFIRVREKSRDLHLKEEQKDSLTDYDRAYQKILRHKGKGDMGELFDTSRLSFLQIQDALKENEAALEFVSYSPYQFMKNSENIYYGAFVLKKNMPSPKFVPLCKATDIQTILDANSTSGSTANLIKSIYDVQAKNLYNAVWMPLINSLKGIEKIYYSPTGLLHNLSFDALKDEKESDLSNGVEFVRVASTKSIVEIINGAGGPAAYENVVLMGGIDYDEAFRPNEEKQTGNKERSGVFKLLSGTASEIDEIEKLLKENDIATSIKSGKKATEEQFYELVKKRPNIVHIATHAFYVKSIEEDMFSISENIGYGALKENVDPMNRSGMAFAGVNQFWKTGVKPLPGNEDGILTANEMAALDLTGTDLVTLSACETAIGKSLDNEGVFGLQRGLKIAGAKNLLLSLWKVDDAVTKEYMTSFYSFLISEKSTMQEAYVKTRDTIKKQHPEPYFWASFVLIQ